MRYFVELALCLDLDTERWKITKYNLEGDIRFTCAKLLNIKTLSTTMKRRGFYHTYKLTSWSVS